MRAAFVLMILVSLTGCETPYKHIGGLYQPGGYEDSHIKDNVYYVNVEVNAFTSREKAHQYLQRRANEVCLENGYRDYRLYGERDTSRIGIIAGHSENAVIPLQNASQLQLPGIAGYVECIH